MMRDKILQFLEDEIIGPCADAVEEKKHEVIRDSPTNAYISGILFPQKTNFSDEEAASNDNTDIPDEVRGEESGSASDEFSSPMASVKPSAIGFSCFLPLTENPYPLRITFGTYQPEKDDKSQHHHQVYRRTPHSNESISIRPSEFLKEGQIKTFPVFEGDQSCRLTLMVIRRKLPKGVTNAQGILLTFSLVNGKITEADSTSSYRDCFFQVCMRLKAPETAINAFLPYPEVENGLSEDDQTNRLLYRNHQIYAVGHGCSPVWESGISQDYIETSFLPTYLLEAIAPTAFDDLRLEMLPFSLSAEKEQTIKTLRSLQSKYSIWIEGIRNKIESLPIQYRDPAKLNLKKCKESLTRLATGIDFLEEDDHCFQSFCLMNEAMLRQQLMYNMPLQEWHYHNDSKKFILEAEPLPVFDKEETWPEYDDFKKTSKWGKWRPFQLAFILINIEGISRPESRDRDIVDLIWFPTGGGKTEAYLGLTAYTIFYNRITGLRSSGTEVIMRYTLRLLTTQQFQRAASLITACDLIRRDHSKLKESHPISIGLWVGTNLTPNKLAVAEKAYDKLKGDNNAKYPFILLKCPCCGAGIGKIGKKTVKGLKKDKSQGVVFCCENKTCHYYERILPVYVVDEQLIEQPPTLLIGTVDKFAMLSWDTRYRSFFGKGDHLADKMPPSLIIQDELHLISGPLGSMVGHYEAMVQYLCKPDDKLTGEYRGPKIVASTATISRAKEQINAIYNCGIGNVSVFPSQGIDAGESFFAEVDHSAPGRLYAGVFAASSPSMITTEVRVFAALLQAAFSCPGNEMEKDAYFTLVAYYNSLRELGHAVTLMDSDVPERLKVLHDRLGLPSDQKRYHNYHRRVELTSRLEDEEIPANLQKLERKYNQKESVEACLATNMISVGLDVPRLGLMCVIGQPKNTSEYIQATSRVGRDQRKPGLVITLLHPTKARDRSYFEHFQAYHSRLYAHVEPTSVTPYSVRVRERALGGVLVGMLRNQASIQGRNIPREMIDNPHNQSVFLEVLSFLKERVLAIDSEESDDMSDNLDKLLSQWRDWMPMRFGGFSESGTDVPLMIPMGTDRNENWSIHPWETPSSMRNVDKSCQVVRLTSSEA